MAESTKAPEEQTIQQPAVFVHNGFEEAFLAAQQEMEPLFKDANNDHYKHKYPTLAAVNKVVLPILNKHGISHRARTVRNEHGEWVVRNRFVHVKSGDIDESDYPIVCSRTNDPQAFGAGLTYARRYSLMAAVGLAPEDDDGNLASPPPVTRPQYADSRKPTTQQPPKPTTPPAAPKPPAPATDRVSCEIPSCKNTIRAGAEKDNRDMHEGHVICQFHSTNGSWQAALTPKPADFGPAPDGIDQDMYDSAEAAFYEQKSIRTNPDGSTEKVAA